VQGRLKIIGLLVLLVVIAIIPLVAARYVFNHTSKLHIRKRNHGAFVRHTSVADLQVTTPSSPTSGGTSSSPASGGTSSSPTSRGLSAGSSVKNFSGRWILLYNTQGGCCDNQCQKAMLQLHQVRIASHNGIERSLLVLLQSERCSIPQLQKSDHIWQLNPAQEKTWQKKLPGNKSQVFIIDPNGWVVLKYPANVNPKSVYEDFRVLLHTSQIG